MDSFFSKGFKGAKCRTLLKLTIPRIKLLRNRREIQLKQMRRDIAKLLETGQEATARIKVEHIIREEKMMAAQEIVELFCELITVRLPIIEAQRECPLDLKEAISSICFAAPRCADLTELLQVQMLFAGKYGKEFVAAATELRPECGVNRQLIELLSIRAPPPEVKLKLLKDIAEEHELDWDPSASEGELMKPHEDLLNGPTQFVSGSKVPLSEKPHDESLNSVPTQASLERSDSDDYEKIDFPEVPRQPLRPGPGNFPAPEMLPFPASALSDADEDFPEPYQSRDEVLQEKSVSKEYDSSDVPASPVENKQFLPFISPPSQSAATTFSVKQYNSPPLVSRTKSDANVDLQDVLAAAQAAAESAERAASAARSAASLAQLRINELVKGKNEDVVCDTSSDNPFHIEAHKPDLPEEPHLDRPSSFSGSEEHDLHENNVGPKVSNIPSYDDGKSEIDSPLSNINVTDQSPTADQFQRLPSMDDDPYFSYPNLFTSQNPNLGGHSQSFTDNSRSTHDK